MFCPPQTSGFNVLNYVRVSVCVSVRVNVVYGMGGGGGDDDDEEGRKGNTVLIPELAGFWMLSLLLQFPLQMFLFVNEETIPSPIERAVQGIMLSFLIVQLISGFFALRHASQHQAKRFHIMQFQTPPGSRSELNLVTKID
ncbi:hypothetical protein ANN_21273 [Periplaneta americana]|uniref:Uncharacterized protein n=1 Tax=Periplaneta americana TaxID=6978 RepID=A0ABQ8SFQ0_PERAM|nr:hypothetical protein ANN_21273 [Periplaneta americana]